MGETRLVRRVDDRIVAGVSGGIADYLNIDPLFIRLAFLLLVLSGGMGLPLYLALMLLMPTPAAAGRPARSVIQENVAGLIDDLQQGVARLSAAARPQPLATAVIVVGVYLLIRNVTGFRLDLRLVGPLLLVGLGVYVAFGRRQG